jgi:hypothetical protein
MPCITKSVPLVRGTSFVYRSPSLFRGRDRGRGNTPPSLRGVRNISYREYTPCLYSLRLPHNKNARNFSPPLYREPILALECGGISL